MLNVDGSFTYTPNLGFVGTDKFAYAASDGLNKGNIAIVGINVMEVLENTLPVANNDYYEIDQDTTLKVLAPGILKNDSDADGDKLTAVLQTDVSFGILVLNVDGSMSYTPKSGFVGSDSFTYIVSDGKSKSTTAKVVINVLKVTTPATSEQPTNTKLSDTTTDTHVSTETSTKDEVTKSSDRTSTTSPDVSLPYPILPFIIGLMSTILIVKKRNEN